MASLEDILEHFTRDRSGRDRKRRYKRASYSGPDLFSLARRLKKLIMLAIIGVLSMLLLLVVGVIIVVLNFSTVRDWAGESWAWARGAAGQANGNIPDLQQTAEGKLAGLKETAREWSGAIPPAESSNLETLATVGSLTILSNQLLGGLDLSAAELTAARAEVARVVQGLQDGRITSDAVARLTDSLYRTDAQGNRVLGPADLTTVQRLIGQARQLANTAGIPPSPETAVEQVNVE